MPPRRGVAWRGAARGRRLNGDSWADLLLTADEALAVARHAQTGAWTHPEGAALADGWGELRSQKKKEKKEKETENVDGGGDGDGDGDNSHNNASAAAQRRAWDGRGDDGGGAAGGRAAPAPAAAAAASTRGNKAQTAAANGRDPGWVHTSR